jgi:ABC-type lipoprotein release transport system permease subunit
MNEKLRKCEDCEGLVSKRATICPHCGAPQEMLEEAKEEITEVQQDEVEQFMTGYTYIAIYTVAVGVAGFCLLVALQAATNGFSEEISKRIFYSRVMIENLSQDEILRFHYDRSRERDSLVLALFGSIFLTLGYLAEGITNLKRSLRHKKRIFHPVIYGISTGYLTYIFPILVEIFAGYRAVETLSSVYSSDFEKQIKLSTLRSYYDTDLIYFNTVTVPIFALISTLFFFAILNRKKGA